MAGRRGFKAGGGVHSRQACKALRQLAETVEGVDVGRLDPVGHEAHKGILVQLDAHDQLNGGQGEVFSWC